MSEPFRFVADLPGPSRRILVEPLEIPAPAVAPAEPEEDDADTVEAPERETVTA